jgi:hypothetical protein
MSEIRERREREKERERERESISARLLLNVDSTDRWFNKTSHTKTASITEANR